MSAGLHQHQLRCIVCHRKASVKERLRCPWCACDCAELAVAGCWQKALVLLILLSSG